MDVRVTSEHIEAGEPNNPTGCAITLALGDLMSGDIGVFDGKAYACDALTDGKVRKFKNLSADLPDVADEFVDRFDRREPVEPIEFALTWIDEHGCEVTP